MRDRVVQYPNRFKLTQVSGDIYDLTPEPGIVTEQGTSLNKANLLPDATEIAIWGNAANRNVAEALSKLKEHTLYERIRDIADVSATTSLSIDVSDIDWTVWRTVRIVCEAKCASDINVRINNISTINYKPALILPGSSSVSSTAVNQLCKLRNGTAWAYFDCDVELNVSYAAPRPFFRIYGDQISYDNVYFGTAKYDATITGLSTINFVATTSSHVVYLRNTSLWGIKR